MLVLDNPSIHDMPVPFGTLVVVSLDPIASVAALEDEQATAEAASILPGKYLALVDLPGEMVYSSTIGGVQLALCFLLAGPGLPSPPYSKAAVPIAPTPPHSDLDRPPAHASRPLPWPDYYFHTLEYLTARVSRVYQIAHAGPSFTDDDHDEIKYASGMDTRAYPQFDVEPDESDDVNCDTWAASQDGVRDIRADDERGHDKLPSPGPDDPLSFPIQFKEGRPEMTLHVQMWVDITAFEHLDRPEKLRGEHSRLLKIEREWAQRTIRAMMSKEPQTTAWLEATVGADAPYPCDDDRSAVSDDDLVGPEDAIEHRVERSLLDSQDHGYTAVNETLLEIPPADDLAIGIDDSLSSVQGGACESPTPAASAGTHTSGASDALAPKHSGGPSVFRWVICSVGTLVSRCRSYFWSLFFPKVFSRSRK